MRQHLLRQPAEFGCTTARKPGTAGGCRERTGTAAAAGVRQKRYGRPRKPCSQNRAAEIAAKAIDSQKSGAEPSARQLTTGNRAGKVASKAIDSQKSGAEITARQLTTGNRAGKVAARRLTAGNRSAETIDNRESGRRELPETAAARPLRRISRDDPRQRIPLPT